MYFHTLISCFIDHFRFVSDFRQIPRRNVFKFFPIFVLCCFRCRYLHCLRHRNKFVYQNIMMQWITRFPCNVVFVNFGCKSTHTQLHGFLCFQDTRIFWLVIIILATGCPVPSVGPFTRHCKNGWDFQLFPCILDDLLEFIIFRFNEIHSSAFGHFRASVFHWPNFAFPSFSTSLTYFSRFLATNDQALMLLAVSFINLSMKQTNLLIHRCSNNHRCGFPCITSNIVWVALVTSKYFSEIGNDSLLGV